MSSIITELKIFGTDEFDNFTGMFGDGDYVKISTDDGTFEGSINVQSDYVELEDNDFEIHKIDVDDIKNIEGA